MFPSVTGSIARDDSVATISPYAADCMHDTAYTTGADTDRLRHASPLA
ncbi:hypothetical protein OH687_28400 [Burkholderia anthina]|nr:hypothetical protein OH687_28400 [Burkholderia anthina]